jgi:hypothetical protein
MRDALTSLIAAVDHESIAISQAKVVREFHGNDVHVPQQFLILFRHIRMSDDDLPRDNQNVGWCLGVDVPKGQAMFVLVQQVSLDLFVDNLQKDIGRKHLSSSNGFDPGSRDLVAVSEQRSYVTEHLLSYYILSHG